jgi:hypothetical protein
MTEWPARRVRYDLVCGKMVGGRPACQGKVGHVAHSRLGPMASPPTGYVEYPSGFWRPSARSLEKMAVGRPAGWRRGGPREHVHPTPVPWRIRCPQCSVIVVVDETVLY